MTDGVEHEAGAGMARAVVRRPRVRGHVTLGTRMWGRIRREFAAGASVPWLSARYGAGERTIGARAKKEGWRRKDLAETADADLEAAEVRGEVEAPGAPVVGAGLALDGTTREALEACDAGGQPDLAEAMRRALGRAVRAMEVGDPRQAQDYLRLARMLEGVGGGEAGDGGRSPEDEAALAFILERLGAGGE